MGLPFLGRYRCQESERDTHPVFTLHWPTDIFQALNEACGKGKYSHILNSTVGIVFLGTPHQGSGAATIGQIAAGVAGAFLPGAQVLNRGLVKNLERNSDSLFETSNRFAHICSELQIYSFFESRPLGSHVVRQQT